jgi:hypothetical protein
VTLLHAPLRDMTIDFSSPRVRRALVKFTETGVRSNCPFCGGRMIASVSPGQRIILLRGMYAGYSATVSDQPGWSDDEFLVQFDVSEEGTLTRISYGRDSFTYSPLKKIPDWLCHLSIDDLSAIEDSCLNTALDFATAKGIPSWADLLLPVFSTIRSRRLPVVSDDIWSTLVAHGFSMKHKQKFKECFDFGLRLLLLFNGRPPIRRRRMAPMSRGRYLTPGQEEWWGPSPTLTS